MTVEAVSFPDLSLDEASPPGPGPIRLGSEAHKNLVCHALLTTFDPYRPAVIDWPIDSFFAFGLFETAKSSGFFPPELVDTFEPVMREEGRHILFFVNWVAWHRRNMPLWRRPYFALKIAAVWAFPIWERIGIAK